MIINHVLLDAFDYLVVDYMYGFHSHLLLSVGLFIINIYQDVLNYALLPLNHDLYVILFMMESKISLGKSLAFIEFSNNQVLIINCCYCHSQNLTFIINNILIIFFIFFIKFYSKCYY